MSELYYEQELYNAGNEAPPYCDLCGYSHFGECDEDDEEG